VIIRWVIVTVMIIAWGLLLWPLWGPVPVAPSVLPATDEILAYRADPEKPVSIKVPSSIDALVVSTWALVPRTSTCDVKARFAYGFEATFVDDKGKDVQSHRFELESRLSCDDKDPEGAGEYAARVAVGDEWVLDPRTTVLRTGQLLPHGGHIRLRGLPVAVKDVLARVEGRYRRGAYERQLYEMSLDEEDRRRVISDMTSLGFEDLPEAARARALSGWDRRLDAAGREGVDYTLRRLLLRPHRTAFPAAVGQVPGFPVSERHAAAINVMGPVEFDVVAPLGRKVRIAEGWQADPTLAPPPAIEKPVVKDEHQWIHVTSKRAEPRTFVVDAEEGDDDFVVRFVLPRVHERAQIGDLVAIPLDGGQLEIRPDVRTAKYLKLDPDRPVVARVAPGQQFLGLLIRAELPPGSRLEAMEGTVIARWGPGPNERAELSQVLPRSRFERWGNPRVSGDDNDDAGGDGPMVVAEGRAGDATDPRRAILRIPQGVERIELFGDPHMRVSMRVLDPGVPEDLLRIPYRVPLKEDDEIWRYAPFDVRKWTPIRAQNQEELERKGRISDLYEQVRIEPKGVGAGKNGDKPERPLAPDGAPIRRRFLAPFTLGAKDPMPNDGWTLLADKPMQLGVAYGGPRGGRMKVVYRAEASALSETAQLWIDGKPMVEQPIATLSGALRASGVKAGVHDIQVKGIGDGLALVDAAPWGGGSILRRRDVYELKPKQPLTFSFRQRKDETLTLVLFAITEASARPFKLHYTIDGGKPRSRGGAFFREITAPAGDFEGRTGDFAMGLLWEANRSTREARRNPDGASKIKIPIGDDLVPDVRTIKIESVDRLWIGAVLVGQPAMPGDLLPRMWSEDDL
jgi:hypothetical protein